MPFESMERGLVLSDLSARRQGIGSGDGSRKWRFGGHHRFRSFTVTCAQRQDGEGSEEREGCLTVYRLCSRASPWPVVNSVSCCKQDMMTQLVAFHTLNCDDRLPVVLGNIFCLCCLKLWVGGPTDRLALNLSRRDALAILLSVVSPMVDNYCCCNLSVPVAWTAGDADNDKNV